MSIVGVNLLYSGVCVCVCVCVGFSPVWIKTRVILTLTCFYHLHRCYTCTGITPAQYYTCTGITPAQVLHLHRYYTCSITPAQYYTCTGITPAQVLHLHRYYTCTGITHRYYSDEFIQSERALVLLLST